HSDWSISFRRLIHHHMQCDDGFYETVEAYIERPEAAVARPYPAAASAPPLPAVGPGPAAPAVERVEADTELLQAVQAATSLLKAYRTHGHLAARLDPLGTEPRGDPALEPETLNLTPELMSRIPASILRIG